MNKETVIVNNVVNSTFRTMYRVVDMLCLELGKDVSVQFKGVYKLLSEFSFHIQTQWRFVYKNTILLASRDIYNPYYENVPDDWDYDIFGHSKEESSIFDAICGSICERLNGKLIEDCIVSNLGDLYLLFSDGTEFETFTSTSIKEEVWRMLNRTTGVHTIIWDEE